MPATAPNSFEANTIDLAIEMLCQSATFRALVGAADAAAARGYIVNGYGGDPVQAGGQGKTTMADGTSKTRPANYALVAPDGPMRRELVAFREYSHSGRINVVVIASLTASENAESITMRGRNLMGTILNELEAQLGLAGRLLAADLNSEGPSVPDMTGSKRGTFDFLITIDWRDIA